MTHSESPCLAASPRSYARVFSSVWASLCFAFATLVPSVGSAQLNWPEGQLLPSFPAPAEHQDLIYIHTLERATYEAEGSRFGHKVGVHETDGWLCQTNTCTPDHMLYGPYETGLAPGTYTARFRMKTDSISDDTKVATIEVNNFTTNKVIAQRSIVRKDFNSVGEYKEFGIDFVVEEFGHSFEFRVHWTGASYLKVDKVIIVGPHEELTLWASMKAVVNATKPRIFSYEGDAHAEGPYAWLESLGLTWTEHKNQQEDNWKVLEKYKNEIKGLILFDVKQPATVNLATTLAGREKALVVSPAFLSRLSAAPYNFPIIEDLRGRFNSALEVYNYMYDHLWSSLSHRALASLSPFSHRGSLREYVPALNVATIWLDPTKQGESQLLDKFLSSLDPGAVVIGWWPDEGPGIERASRHGIATVPSDYATNLTMHSGFPRRINVKPIPPKPILQNKIYVAFILSDGDNLQYVEHLLRKLWNNPNRGKVPIGWTMSPTMLDAMPGALNFFHESSTPNDNIISGPSGWGYGYPNMWNNQTSLERYLRVTNDYAERAGMRIVTVWNHITGGIDQSVGEAYAAFAPSLLGVTAQNTGGPHTVYSGKLPGIPLSCNYCTNEQAMKDHIASAARNWNGAEPRFILIQAQPWQDVTPTTFMNVANSLGSDYVVVRPDNWFQLFRQARGLPIEPLHPVAPGVYRLYNKASKKCVTVGGTVNGLVRIAQTECAEDDAQRFRVTPTSNGYVKLVSMLDESKVIDIDGGPGAKSTGVKTILWDDLSGTNQQFQPVWESADEYHLIARHSDLCLDVPGSTTADEQLQQWTCNGTNAQIFRFVPPDGPVIEPPVDMPDGGMPDAGSGDDDGVYGDAGVPGEAGVPGGGDGSDDTGGGSPIGDAGPSVGGDSTGSTGEGTADGVGGGMDGTGVGVDVGSESGGCSTTGTSGNGGVTAMALGALLLALRRRRQHREAA